MHGRRELRILRTARRVTAGRTSLTWKLARAGHAGSSRDSRPSLYNPSIEFALLTEHDETLLRMLYDPRLHPGMTAEQIRPLLPEIARDAMAAEQAQKGRTEVATN